MSVGRSVWCSCLGCSVAHGKLGVAVGESVELLELLFALLGRNEPVGSCLKLMAHIACGSLKLVAHAASCLLCMRYEG
jgi:hypothetical protein